MASPVKIRFDKSPEKSVMKSFDHPFGRENELSVHQLFKFFCNNLYLGQWELARSCIKELYHQHDLLGHRIHSVLLDVTKNPYRYSIGGESISTPHHLSWLCLQQYMQLLEEDESIKHQQSLEYVKKDVEFRLLLVEAVEFSDPIIVNELYQCFKNLQNVSRCEGDQQACVPETIPTISDECKNLLQSVLLADPALGYALSEQLTFKESPTLCLHNEQLQRIHLECLFSTLSQLWGNDTGYCSNETAKQQKPDHIRLFYNLLALFNPQKEMKNLSLRIFLEELSSFLNSDQSVLCVNRVYSALLGRNTTFLIDIFCDVDHQCQMKKRQSCSERGECVLSDVGHQILSLCELENRELAWKYLFLTSAKHEKHFLDLIMETAMCLVKTRQFDRLSAMLSPLELRPLRPLVLLVGWDHCTDVDAAKQLLKALGDWKLNTTSESVIEQACERLSHQVRLVQWCLDQTSVLVENQNSFTTTHQASLLLHGVETHSVLHMLHRSKQLSILGQEQTFNILNNRPKIGDFDQPTSSSKAKAVRFAIDEEIMEKAESLTEKVDPIDIEKERDLSIYRSFCALRGFLEAMHFCADTANWESYIQAHNKIMSIDRRNIRTMLKKQVSNQSMPESTHSQTCSFGNQSPRLNFRSGKIMRTWSQVNSSAGSAQSDSDTEQTKREEAKTSMENFRRLYEKNVTEYLKQGRKFLTQLYPIRMRVETLENIFSLLFLTNEDIREEITRGQSDSGEEGAVPESQSGSQVGSRDNLSALESTLEKSYTPSPQIENKSFSFERMEQEQENRENLLNPNSTLVTEDISKEEQSSEVETKATIVGTFSITKTELKDTSSDFPKKNSGNQSANSAGSTGSAYKIGFTANPYIIRDILITLKDCLSDINSMKYRLSSQQPQDPTKGHEHEQIKNNEETLNKHILSSIDNKSLQYRISRLAQYVSEASWRFQLVAPAQLPPEFGKIQSEKAFSESESHSDDSAALNSDEDVGVAKQKRKRKNSHSKYGNIHASTEESECKPTTDDSFASRGSRIGRKRRKRKQFLMLGRNGIMPLLLSDKRTLLNLCLKGAKYSQAQQVVKMFSMEQTGDAAEVMFGEHYAIAVKTLQNLSKRGHSSSQGSRFTRPTLPAGKTSLSAIADVAAAGMVTVSATTTVDQILSLNLLPSFSPDLLEMVANSASALAQHINPGSIQAMIILDLTCVASCLYESTNNLVQMMSQRQPQTPEETLQKSSRFKRSVSQELVGSTEPRKLSMSGVLDTTKEPRKTAMNVAPITLLPGVRGYMQYVFQYVQLIHSEANTEVVDMYLKKGLNERLLMATQPHDLQMLSAYSHMMIDVDRALRRVQRALQDAHKQEMLSLVQAVRSGHQRDSQAGTAGGSQAEKPIIRQAIKHLMFTLDKIVPPEGVYKHLLGLSENDQLQKNEYLHRLYEHVKALSQLVHEAHGDKLLASTIEYFQMLEEGPTQILGKLIFVKRIPPGRLEDVATKLHVNMLQIIINNCCPLVSCRPLRPPAPFIGEEEQNGKLVLNPCSNWIGSVHHPGVVVTEILTKLIGILKDYAELDSTSGIFGPGLMVDVVQDSRYHNLILGLAQLKFIDLSLLQSREEKLSFYGNLINLMTLHLLLRQVQEKVDLDETNNRSSHSSFSSYSRQSSFAGGSGNLDSNSPGIAPRFGNKSARQPQVDTVVSFLPEGELEWLLIQTRMAYFVGQLGVVSLFDLKYFILRNGLPAPSSYGGIIKDRCHELDPSDPWRLYGPPPEPRVLFVISEGHISSPPIQVLSREMVLNQLRTSMKEYLQRTIVVDVEAKMVVLPELLVWHQHDLVTEYSHSGLPCEGLLNLLPTQLDSPLADELRTLTGQHIAQIHGGASTKENDLQVVVKPYLTDYTYTFDFDQFSRLQTSHTPTGAGHRQSASLPWAATGTTSKSGYPEGTVTVGTSQNDQLFHLTPASISYLHSRSELVATVASLTGLIDKLNLQKHLAEEDERSLSPTGSIREKSRQVKLLDRDRSMQEAPSMNQGENPNAVGMVRRSSPLTLGILLRSDNDSPLQVLTPSSSRSSRSSSPASMQISSSDYTIAENRYQQLVQKLPHIWRHILLQVVPLEVSRDPDLLALSSEELLSKLCHRELTSDSRTAILLSPSDQQLHDAILILAKILILQRDWLALVRLLRSLPELLLQTFSDLPNIHDFACCCVAYTCGESQDISDTDSNDLWRHLLLIKDVATRCRTVLSMAQFWPVDIAVELLEVCYNGQRPDDQTLYAVLCKRLEETRIYQRVTEAAKNLLQKVPQSSALNSRLTSVSDDEQEDEDDEPLMVVTDKLTVANLEPLCTWQNVVTCTVSSPERVLQVLLEAQEFDIARRWSVIHQIDQHLQQRIEEHYISFLLESSHPNQVEAFQVLERVLGQNPEYCLSLCDNLLTSLQHCASLCFIASFMLQHLKDYMNKYKQEELHLLVTGCKALLCLPESARAPYQGLKAAPLLLLEQLLMNCKIEWVGKILAMVHKNSTYFTDSTSQGAPHSSKSFDVTACDALLVKYATRALEFPVLYSETPDTSGMVRTDSHASISSQASTISHASQLGGPMGVTVFMSPSRKLHPSYSSSTLASQRTVSQAGSPTSSTITASSRRPGTSSRRPSSLISCQPSSTTNPAATTIDSASVSAQPGLTDGPFIMPVEPPSKEQWVPDSSTKVCMVCGVERFSMFVRRHHCRRCGRVVCAGCSSRTMMIRGTSARTCDQCFSQSFKSKGVDEQGRLQQFKERISGVSSTGSGSVPRPEDPSPFETDHTPTVSLLAEYTYILFLDDERNDLQREEFYYDQAPSTSLCLSILELHSSPKQCGDIILQLCDDVSKHLQPLAPGVRNQEVDYGFVISMLKYLLFNAKVKLLKAGDNAGVARCDVYLGRLVLLRQLVAANCSYIPSMQQLTKMDSLRRLRDQLIQEERLPLAMEVSTKCGIDPAGVWMAWGMALLRTGDYNTARDKFSHCLKPLMDKNTTHQSNKPLSDIIDQLESGPVPKTTQAQGLFAPLVSMKELLSEPQPTSSVDVGMKDEAVTKECLYYLNTYGSHLMLASFYLRHGNLNKAVHYILDMRCTQEVFVEGLLVPCLSSGKLTRLQDNMLMVDPTLERWALYITAMCRYLDKNKLIHTLYQTQLFTKDFIRAAMTCITYFYQRDATSYEMLSGRVNHLLNAKHHLECYLSDRQWGTSHTRPGTARSTGPTWGPSGSPAGSTSLCLIMTPGEVNKYINTISLQIDVTKFLHRYNENLDTIMKNLQSMSTQSAVSAQAPLSPSSRQLLRTVSTSPDTPATLFGSTRMKADVANLVLLAGNNVNDGFGLAFRIIQDFKLDATFIYVQAGRYFSRLHKYSSVRQLLSCIKDSGLCTDQSFDDVVSACIRVISDDATQAKEVEALIKMIRSDASKINAYMLSGKLRSAYLNAVKGERVEDIQRIAAAAERTGQAAVKKICDKWLAGRIRAQDLSGKK